jgi:signal transduction histidine kinase
VTLRSRLFATIVAAVLVSTVLTVVVSEVLLHHRAQTQALRTLTSNAAVLAASPLRTAGAGGHPHANREALRQSGALGSVFTLRAGSTLTDLRPLKARQAKAVLAAIPGSFAASGKVTIAGRPLLFAARSGRLGRVVLVRSARLGKGDAPPFALPIVLVGALGALLSALLAWLVARRVTRPLRELAEASSRLAHTQDHVTIARPAHAPREVVALVDVFNDMARKLVTARGAQRDFLLQASHELKSPITAILGHAEGIEDGAVAPGEGASVIATEARRLQRLVADLLDLARIDRHEFETLRERVELGAVARTVLERHAARARALDVELRVGGDDVVHFVWGDRERLIQTTSNLLENALRVSPPGSSVELEVGEGCLAVNDRGPGLSDSERQRAFERFYLHRLHRDASRGGAGVGLAIVAELMSAMGGEARVAARAGGGTRFELLLRPVGTERPARSATADAGVAR